MAWLQTDPSGNFHISFRFGNKKFKRSLKTKIERVAQGKKLRLEETISLLESGRLTLPELVDVPTFLMSDGKLDSKPVLSSAILDDLSQEFLKSIPTDSLEPGTIKMFEMHIRHLARHLGKRFDLQRLCLADLQSYVNHRATDPGIRGRTVGGSTIKKEIVTLRGIWNWAILSGNLPDVPLPSRGLRYPKSFELPPFQTFSDVSRQTSGIDPQSAEAKDLWATVFLNVQEVEELLEFVETNARYAFVFPMFVLAAHSGARRSEILRSQTSDVGENTFTIREKKRKKQRNSTRQVPISARLKQVLADWFQLKPQSAFTICHEHGSRCRSNPGDALTPSEADKHFSGALKGSKFEQLRGWHVFRHSFCSNCAAKGLDQRVIDEWVGHTTEEMRRRYRHLFPNTQQAALDSVFS